MESWSMHLVVFGCVLFFMRVGHTQFLGTREPVYWGSEMEAQSAAAGPERGHFREAAEHRGWIQQQKVWPSMYPLSWSYPEHPVVPVKMTHEPQVRLEWKWSPKERVAVRCGESRIMVEVSQDLLGLGKLIKPEDITLGGCPAIEVDEQSQVVAFESELHGCGSTLVMTENFFIYAFTLFHSPRVLDRSGITRSQGAVVGVECHYPR